MKTTALILTLTLTTLNLSIGKEEGAKTTGFYQISKEEMEMLYDIAGINSEEETNKDFTIKVYNDEGEMITEAQYSYGEVVSDDSLNEILHKIDFLFEIDNVAYYRVSQE
ncbi:MAG: hypothetical protein AAF363_09255 [Bacteroidota bacterium]